MGWCWLVDVRFNWFHPLGLWCCSVVVLWFWLLQCWLLILVVAMVCVEAETMSTGTNGASAAGGDYLAKTKDCGIVYTNTASD